MAFFGAVMCSNPAQAHASSMQYITSSSQYSCMRFSQLNHQEKNVNKPSICHNMLSSVGRWRQTQQSSGPRSQGFKQNFHLFLHGRHQILDQAVSVANRFTTHRQELCPKRNIQNVTLTWIMMLPHNFFFSILQQIRQCGYLKTL